MNSKMVTDSQLSKTEPKKQKQKQTKQTSLTGTESQKWSFLKFIFYCDVFVYSK